MLVLFETPAGYALFKVLNSNKLMEVPDVYQFFQTPEKAAKAVKLEAFQNSKILQPLSKLRLRFSKARSQRLLVSFCRLM